LMLVPAFAPRIRLRELIADDLQILPEWRLQKSLPLTRAILAATAQAARDRGARPLFVGVVFGPAPHLLRDMLEGLPHRIVALDPARIMRWDGHPDPQGARQIADAIVQYVNSPRARTAVMAARLTTSCTAAPCCSTLTGFAMPIGTGPITSAPPSRQ